MKRKPPSSLPQDLPSNPHHPPLQHHVPMPPLLAVLKGPFPRKIECRVSSLEHNRICFKHIKSTWLSWLSRTKPATEGKATAPSSAVTHNKSYGKRERERERESAHAFARARGGGQRQREKQRERRDKKKNKEMILAAKCHEKPYWVVVLCLSYYLPVVPFKRRSRLSCLPPFFPKMSLFL